MPSHAITHRRTARHPWPRVACALFLAATVASCGPNYHQQRLAQDLQDLYLHEYHLPARVQLLGNSLNVSCAIEGLLKSADGGVEFSPTTKANGTLGDVTEAIHRVALSTDAPVEFYAILASDPTVPGAWLMLVRSLEDVRRVYASAISPVEFWQRTVSHLQYDPAQAVDLSHQYVHGLTLESFLAMQMSKRLQNLFKGDQDLQATYRVGTCAGEFRQGTFQFVVELAPKESGPMGDEETDLIFDEALRLIASILHDYHFDRFNEIQLLHFPSGRTTGVPKTRLWSFLPR